jgi:hypothetical protein
LEPGFPGFIEEPIGGLPESEEAKDAGKDGAVKVPAQSGHFIICPAF